MKRILCVILSLFMIMSFTACKEEDTVSKEPSVDLEYYANSEKIPECKYNLGFDPDALKDELSAFAESEEGSESLYDETEGEKSVCVTNGAYNFYYEKDNEQDGIAYIVSYEKAFGFEIGESIVTVKEKLADTKYTEEEINDDNAFFMFEAGSVIKCKFKYVSIMFVFVNNELSATAIYRNDFLS